MKKQKVGLIVLGCAVVLGGVYFIYKHAKKTYREIDRREKENKNILEKSGLTEEDFEKEDENSGSDRESGVDYDINLSKKLYEKMRFDSGIDLDCIDLEKILDEGPSEHVVHVYQRFDNRTRRNILDFLFEIPLSALPEGPMAKNKRSYADGNTCVGDFVRTVKGKWDEKKECPVQGWVEWMREIVQDPENLGFNIKKGNFFVDCQLEGYIYLSYERFDEESKEWQEVKSFGKVQRTMFENNPLDSSHTKLTEYVYDVAEVLSKGEEVVSLPLDSDEYRNAKICDIICAVRVSFNMQDRWHVDGINVTSASKILNKIYEESEVSGYRDGIFRYERFLFYDPDAIDCVCVFSEERDEETGKVRVISEEII
jgi:hypothetical protein